MSSDDRYQRVNLRIPKDLHARIMEAADAHSHSMNAEIVQRLEKSLLSRAESDGIPLSQAIPALNAEEVSEMLKIFSKAHLRTRGE